MLLTSGVCAAIIAGGCATKRSVSNAELPIEKAKREALLKCGWPRSKVDYAFTLENGNFIILVGRVPARPGSHVTVEITKEGDVVSLIPGL